MVAHVQQQRRRQSHGAVTPLGTGTGTGTGTGKAGATVAQLRSGRGNWHLLSESELTELCLALGVPPEQTGTMSKVGLIAALRTRLVMSKHRGDHGPISSRFERLPAPSFADSRVEAQGSPPRRGLGDASRSHARRSRSSGALGDTTNHDTRARLAAERRGNVSTWKRSAHKRFDMTAEDLHDMEDTFRKQMHSEAQGDSRWTAEQLPSRDTGAGEAENKLRWYENSVLEYGLQINSMVQQSIVGDAAGAAAPTPFAGTGDYAGPPGRSSMGTGTAARADGHSDLVAMQNSFAQLERRMADASMSIDDSCRAAAVDSTVDEMLQGREDKPNFEPPVGGAAQGGGMTDVAATSPESARSAVTQASSQSSDGAGTATLEGLAPWLENGRDGNGELGRHELESAVGTFLARGQGEDEEVWANAVQRMGQTVQRMPTGGTPEAQDALRGGEEWAQRLRRDMPGLSVNARLREY
eukprot:COSAG02_NODE_385_length_23394_cov_43.838807_17_plen_469_part_00